MEDIFGVANWGYRYFFRGWGGGGLAADAGPELTNEEK